MKYLLLLLLSFNLYAGDSGTYYDPSRDGEGISFTRNGDLTQFFFYSYDDHQGCYGLDIQEGGLGNESNCHETVWYYSSGDNFDRDGFIEGWLYTGIGLDYPKGITDPRDPFRAIVGESAIVGRYIIARSEGGWKLIVIHFGDLLPKDHALYARVYDFSTMLLEATD